MCSGLYHGQSILGGEKTLLSPASETALWITVYSCQLDLNYFAPSQLTLWSDLSFKKALFPIWGTLEV